MAWDEIVQDKWTNKPKHKKAREQTEEKPIDWEREKLNCTSKMEEAILDFIFYLILILDSDLPHSSTFKN